MLHCDIISLTGHLRKPYEAAMKEAQIQALFYGFSIGIYYWMYAASFRFGAYLVGIGEMTPIDVFRLVIYTL
jgi:hypothetical protein